jgi:hypothetical protein
VSASSRMFQRTILVGSDAPAVPWFQTGLVMLVGIRRGRSGSRLALEGSSLMLEALELSRKPHKLQWEASISPAQGLSHFLTLCAHHPAIFVTPGDSKISSCLSPFLNRNSMVLKSFLSKSIFFSNSRLAKVSKLGLVSEGLFRAARRQRRYRLRTSRWRPDRRGIPDGRWRVAVL